MAETERYKFPKATVERLSYYFRALEDLSKTGVDTVSSEELGEKLGIKSSQIRKDLSYFGYFGKRGMGYDVKYLLKELRYILGLDREWQIIVVGAGHLGVAISNYPGFKKRGFNVKALFDNDPAKVGKTEGDVAIIHMSKMKRFIKENAIEMAVVAVPAKAAQEVADNLVKCGIKAILNFAPSPITAEEPVRCLSVDLTTKLEALAYYTSFSQEKLWKLVP